MKLENKRIFIDNLPESITQVDLEQKFSEYGSVSCVEVKTRKNSESKSPPQFAYVTVTISKNDLSNCFEEFANKRWKGHWLSLQEAKESFMERLKRERAELNPNAEDSKPSSSYISNNHNKSIDVYHSSSSDEDIPKQDIPNGFQKSFKRKRKYSDTYHTYEENETSSSSNKGKHDRKDLILETKMTDEIPAEVSESNKKRMESIIRMRKNYLQQKQVLRTALSNIDSKPNNKIRFEDASEILQTHKSKEDPKLSNAQVALFDEDDEPEREEYNFHIKEQFEGKKGQKLMQLQSRFKNDKRFAMDERFLDDGDADETIQETEITFDEEKQKQFEILEQVLGKKVKQNSEKRQDERQNVKMMLRFDPSQPNHSKFEIKEDKKKKHNTGEKSKVKVVEDEPKPEVSKETFYKVAVNLKDTLHEKEGFSLANLFSKTIETVDSGKEDDVVINEEQKRMYQEELNPFPYDSSADEDYTHNKSDEKHLNTPLVHQNKVGPAKLWTESFFFKHDDYRLQEGLDFIKRLEVDEQTDFSKLRRNLHEIVKAKVRNNQRKNRPFRKKLGGKKRLRVKRAMKR